MQVTGFLELCSKNKLVLEILCLPCLSSFHFRKLVIVTIVDILFILR